MFKTTCVSIGKYQFCNFFVHALRQEGLPKQSRRLDQCWGLQPFSITSCAEGNEGEQYGKDCFFCQAQCPLKQFWIVFFSFSLKKKKKRNKQTPHFFRGESFFWCWNLLLLFQFCPCSIFVWFCCTSFFGVPKYSVLLLTLMLITGFFFQHDAIFFIRFLLGFFSEQLHWKQFFGTTRADCRERIVLKA